MIERIVREELNPTAQQGEVVVFQRRTARQSAIPELPSLDALYDYIRMLDCEGYPHAFIESTGFRLEFTKAVWREGGHRRGVHHSLWGSEQMNVLVLAAHPDDEVLGCGGTMARLVDQGAEVHTHILGEGITSRYDTREAANLAEVQALHAQAHRAGAALGVANVVIHSLPDNRFDELALLDVVKLVEGVIKSLAPTVIYTHHAGDLNIDHQIVNRAVLTATRPTATSVQDVLAFEVPSSTEWAFHWDRIPPQRLCRHQLNFGTEGSRTHELRGRGPRIPSPALPRGARGHRSSLGQCCGVPRRRGI